MSKDLLNSGLDRDMKNQEYKKYVFAYLDVLGFENIVKNKANLTRLISLLESFHESESTEKKGFSKTESGFKVLLIPNIMCFSDNIIVSIQADQLLDANDYLLSDVEKYDILLHSVSTMVMKMCILSLEEGMALRGAIGYGDIFIDYSKSIIFGPGLIESIRDEQKKAKYPRVIISESLLDILNKSENHKKCNNFPSPIIYDSADKIYHIDYLKMPLVNFISKGCTMKIKKIAYYIVYNHNSANMKHKKKWKWLINYYNTVIDDLMSEHTSNNAVCKFTQCKHPNNFVFKKLKISSKRFIFIQGLMEVIHRFLSK